MLASCVDPYTMLRNVVMLFKLIVVQNTCSWVSSDLNKICFRPFAKIVFFLTCFVQKTYSLAIGKLSFLSAHLAVKLQETTKDPSGYFTLHTLKTLFNVWKITEHDNSKLTYFTLHITHFTEHSLQFRLHNSYVTLYEV